MNKVELQRYFDKVARTPLTLGVADCVTFVVDALRVGFDRDYRDVLDYSDRLTAVYRLRSAGGLRSAVTEALGRMVWVPDLPHGSVIWIEPQNDVSQQCIGLLMPGYVAVKGNRCIHRLEVDINMRGWLT